MDITFKCGWCGQQIVVDEVGAGLATECPKCGQPITVPSPARFQAEPPTTPSQSPAPHETKKCPFCAETIKREAIVCKHCGRDLVAKRLTEAVTANVQGPTKSDVPAVGITNPEKTKYRIGLLVILAISFGVGGLWFYRYAHRLSIPEIFKTQLMKFIEEGNKINSMSSLGVSYADFKNQVATAQSSYTLAVAAWPNAFAADSKEEFAKALDGWRLTLRLWELKIKWAEDTAVVTCPPETGPFPE